MNKIESFRGEYSFLSNMAILTKPIKYDGVDYWSTENFYVAMKTTNKQERVVVRGLSPSKAKQYGRREDFPLRKDWEDIKDNVMWFALDAKFEQQPFKSKLLATGDAYIEEGNWWGDTYWGVCNGVGQNKLGKMLMLLRDELRSETNGAET